MSRQDYVAIAAVLAAELAKYSGPTPRSKHGGQAVVNITVALAGLMAAGNPRFNRQQFYRAAGMTHSMGRTTS